MRALTGVVRVLEPNVNTAIMTSIFKLLTETVLLAPMCIFLVNTHYLFSDSAEQNVTKKSVFARDRFFLFLNLNKLDTVVRVILSYQTEIRCS